MGLRNQFDFNETASILDEEDEATLAAIDRGIKAAAEGRLVSIEEVRKRMDFKIVQLAVPSGSFCYTGTPALHNKYPTACFT